MTRAWALVAGLTALAAGLRIVGLDAKGFWQDEALTVTAVQDSFGAMFDQISRIEHTPPVYFLAARGWVELFGAGEVGLRSLSVLAGTLTVPAAYLAARALVSDRVGLFTAALVAVNPLLVWYSQEARSYALFVLLATIALIWFGLALDDPSVRNLGLWAASSALAAATHYFGAFSFVAEAAWLSARHGLRRRVVIALGVPVAAGLALLPLAFAQEEAYDIPLWIREIGLPSRLIQIPGIFLVGFELSYPLILALAGVAALAAAVALVLLASRGSQRERRGAVIAGTVGVAVILVPLVLVAAGLDYLIYKNVIAALVPLAVLVGAGFAGQRSGLPGLAAGLVLIATSVGVVLATASEPKYRREAWREAADALGPPSGPRAVVATPGDSGADPLLRVYLPDAERLGEGSARVSELVLLALPRRGLGAVANPELPEVTEPPPAPAPGFRLVEARRDEDLLLFLYRSPVPRRVDHAGLAAGDLDPDNTPVVLLDRPR